MTSELDARLAEAAACVRHAVSAVPSVGIVLGSGLGGFVDRIQDATALPYEDIAHMPRPTVAGHGGRMVVGALGSATVACLQGRVHLYEGHEPERVVFGVRLLARVGCRIVLLTNAAGGVAEGLASGDLMLITDHINLTGANPLVGPEPTFLDLTNAYDPGVRRAAHQAARRTGLRLVEGIYAGMPGPCYETPAEICILKTLGAHAVGMSTVLEVIALRHLGVSVGAVSTITNLAAGGAGAVLDHAHVQRVAESRGSALATLLCSWVENLGPSAAPATELSSS
jgi:purine-nucleoside phosphorylase